MRWDAQTNGTAEDEVPAHERMDWGIIFAAALLSQGQAVVKGRQRAYRRRPQRHGKPSNKKIDENLNFFEISNGTRITFFRNQ